MVSKNKQREQAIGQLSAHLLETGLSEASLRQLAAAAGISDRMLLYYFTDKTDVLAATLTQIAADMAALLATSIPDGVQMVPAALIAKTAELTRSSEMRPYMRLWIQIVAAAAREEPPYTFVAKQITAGFLQWIEQHLEVETEAGKRSTAAMILAMIDGLALLDVCTDGSETEMAILSMNKLSHPDST